jgi:iron complex outermembrane receptor protein
MVIRILASLTVLIFAVTALAEDNEKPDGVITKPVATVTETVPVVTKPTTTVPKPEEKATGQEEKITKFKEVVVTATRTEKDVADAPGDVHVVTKEDIEKRNVSTVDEALSDVPGVFDNRGKGLMDTQAQINLRGIPGANRTLILLDGIPINDAFTGNVMWTGMAPGSLDKIEVVEGPFSSLYGGNAMGGVVNIITQMPEKREIVLDAGYGTAWDRGQAMNDLLRNYVSYGDKFFDKLSIFASYGRDSTNGYPTGLNVQGVNPGLSGLTGGSPTTDTSGNPQYLIGDMGNNYWWDDSILVKAQYDISSVSKINFTFMRNQYHYWYGYPHTYLRDASGNPVYSYGVFPASVDEGSFDLGSGAQDQNIYTLGYQTVIGPLKAKLTLGFFDVPNNWYTLPYNPNSVVATTITGGPGQISQTPSRKYTADLQFTVPILNRQLLTFGGSFANSWANTVQDNLSDWKDVNSITLPYQYNSGGRSNTYALFVQDEISILNNLTAYVGAREDWWMDYDGFANQQPDAFGNGAFNNVYSSRTANSFDPKFSLVYKPFELTTLRTDVGRAFRAPTVYELYSTWSYFGYTFASNPNLNPETTESWDVSIEQGLWKGAKVKVTYFENYLSNLIYLETVHATTYQYYNAGKAESTGLVFEAEQKIDKWLRFFANATFTRAVVLENSLDPASVGKQVEQIPDRMYTVGVDGEKGPFLYSAIGTYVSRRYNTDTNSDTVNNVYGSYDPYTVVNVKIGYKVTNFATLSFSVDNIFNERYFVFYQAPGRSWFVDLKLKF